MGASVKKKRTIVYNGENLKLKKVKNSQFEMYVDEEYSDRNRAVRITEKNLRKVTSMAEKRRGISVPTVVVVDFEKIGVSDDVIAGYVKEQDIMYINAKYDTSKKILEFTHRTPGWFADTSELSPYFHELGHRYHKSLVENLANRSGINYNIAEEKIDYIVQDYIQQQPRKSDTILQELSGYAHEGYKEHNYTEIIAECYASSSNIFADNFLEYLLMRIEE